MITAYLARIGERFLTAACAGDRLELRAASTFADGTAPRQNGLRACTVPEADARR